MLATQITAEQEDAVQSELEALQREAGIRIDEPQKTIVLPSAPPTQPVWQQQEQEATPQSQPAKPRLQERHALLA